MEYKIFFRYILFVFLFFLEAGYGVYEIEESPLAPLGSARSSGSFMQPIEKIYLQKKQDKYIFRINFFKGIKFAPRIHTLSNGAKILLSFAGPVKMPANKLLKHGIIKGYFFEKFGPSSLMMVIAFTENVIFLEKKYTADGMVLTFKKNHKKFVIIDAGHGGIDSGASCLSGDYEKNLSLIMAINLRNKLVKTGRYKVFLTRDKDEFISVQNRIQNIPPTADLLISLHADSNNDPNMRGMSIFTLPDIEKLKNSEIFSKEGIERYNRNLRQSKCFARILASYIPNICKIKKRPCRQSELRVLKIEKPAVLLEFGCVSNKIDNELLHLKDFREKTVNAILYALDKFFEKGYK